MQEAFGGTFMLKLFMIFFIIYVSFIGVALNFAKIYRIKNNVINILEQYQYKGDSSSTAKEGSKIYTEMEKYLDSVPYGSKKYFIANQDKCPNGDKDLKNLGICVVAHDESNDQGKKAYYTVTVYYVVDLPILSIPGIVITANGETIVMES